MNTRQQWFSVVAVAFCAVLVAGCGTSSSKKKSSDASTSGGDSGGSLCSNGKKDNGEADVDCGGTCGACTDGKGCALDADCASGQCGVTYTCTSSACSNNKKDLKETGIDCGGDCLLCPGDTCSANPQCTTGFCKTGVCDTPSCTDGQKNGAETGVDCGGDCGLCADGQGCLLDAGCTSGFCNQAQVCATASCTDNEKNGPETDVDCGGSCGKCADGKICSAKEDCTSGKCDAGTCKSLAATCANGKKDGDETDVDCGGGCGGCGYSDACGVPSDCTSGLCADGKCTAPATCSDAQLTPGETDVDCGGPGCPGCALGKTCKAHADCLSIACVLGVCKEPSCDDVSANGKETDVDCGGLDCGKCADGQLCKGNDDCGGGNCTGGRCGSCTDTKLNGTETDVDCGGACEPCSTGKKCTTPDDCESGDCGGGVCVSCNDKIKNGNETDVDCGGGCAAKCANNQTCSVGDDCSGGGCGDGKCCAANACGGCGAVPTETCNGKDDDCDGKTDEDLTPEPCANQKGVCAGSKSTCSGTGGWVCDATALTAIVGYEAKESLCDKLDNDCNGQTDEAGCTLCGAAVALNENMQSDYFKDYLVGTEFFALNKGVPTGAFSAYNTNGFGRDGYLATAEFNLGNVDADVMNGPSLAFTGTDLVAGYRKDMGSMNLMIVAKLDFTADEWYSRSSDIPQGGHETVVAVGGGKELVVYVNDNYEMWYAMADAVGDFQTWSETQLESNFDSGVAAKVASDGTAYFAWRFGGAGNLVISTGQNNEPNMITSDKAGIPDMAIGSDGTVHVAYQVAASKKVFLFSTKTLDPMPAPLEVGTNVTSQNVAVAVGPDNVPFVAWVVESNKVNVVKIEGGKVIQVSKKSIGTQASDYVEGLEIEVVEKGLVHIAAHLTRLNAETFGFTTTCQGYNDAAPTCVPKCAGKTCGDDTCGGNCGVCTGGKTCNASGQCATSCTPSCGGKTCGDNGCGGSCGTCGSGKTCNTSGQCVTSGGGTDQFGLPTGCLLYASTSACNPVTNAECTALGAGNACDLQSDGTTGCFPPPNDAKLGATCSNASGPYCAGTLHCNGTCMKFCCTATDCGGKTCTPLDPANYGTIGVCSP